MLVEKEKRFVGGEWRDMPFSESVQVNPKVSLEKGKLYPYVDMAAIDSNSRNAYAPMQRKYSGGGSRFCNGDTLMARITPCLENGKIARFTPTDLSANTPAHGSTEFIVLRGWSNITDTEFVYYLTQWNEVHNYAIDQMTGTSGRQRVPTDCFDHLLISVPPLPEQRAIAHILGTLDDKIELNRRMNETLEAMARTLFKSWFVDFDPVRAKMEGRDTGLPRHIADLFPDRLVESELGEIPEGWEVVSLPEMIEINPKRSLRKGEVASYLGMANMPTKGHIPDSITKRPFGSGMRFSNGDTLVARITPCLENGKTAYVDFLKDDEVGWGSTEYIVLKSRPPIPDEFSYCLARGPSFRDFAIQSMTGTSGRQRVPATALSHFRLPSPPKQLTTIFGKTVQPLFARASEAARESRFLTALRDALLSKLVSGELRVQNTEQFIGKTKS